MLIRIFLFLTMISVSFDVFLNIKVGSATVRFCQFLSVGYSLLYFVYHLKNEKELKERTILRRIYLPLIFLITQAFISTLISIYPIKTFFYAGWLLFNAIFFVMITINVVSSNKILADWSVNFYVLSFLLVGLFGIYQSLGGMIGLPVPFVQSWIGRIPRASGFSYEPSYFSTYLIIGLVLTGSQLMQQKIQKLILVTHFVTAIAIVLSTARTGLVVMSLYYLYMLFQGITRILKTKRVNNFWLFQMTIIVCTGIFVLISVSSGMQSKFLNFFIDVQDNLVSTSLLPRLSGSTFAFEAFLDHPFFGVGFGDLGAYLLQTNPMSIILMDQSTDPNSVWSVAGTNVSTELLSELGICGVFLFVWFLTTYLRNVVRIYKNLEKGSVEQSWICSLLLALIFELIVLQFNQNILRTYFWFHLGITLGVSKAYALAHIKSREKNQEDKSKNINIRKIAV